MQKYSGSTTILAPCLTAMAIKRSASIKLEDTCGLDAIWMPATLTLFAEFLDCADVFFAKLAMGFTIRD